MILLRLLSRFLCVASNARNEERIGSLESRMKAQQVLVDRINLEVSVLRRRSEAIARQI